MVHGEAKTLRAETQSSVLYDESVTESVTLDRIMAAFQGDQRLAKRERSQCVGVEIWKIAVDVGLVPSKSGPAPFSSNSENTDLTRPSKPKQSNWSRAAACI